VIGQAGTVNGLSTPSTDQTWYSFTNFSSASSFTFSVFASSGNVYLELTPIPEPGASLGIAAFALLAGIVWQRRRRPEPALAAAASKGGVA
jgi:hypothetical protein